MNNALNAAATDYNERFNAPKIRDLGAEAARCGSNLSKYRNDVALYLSSMPLWSRLSRDEKVWAATRFAAGFAAAKAAAAPTSSDEDYGLSGLDRTVMTTNVRRAQFNADCAINCRNAGNYEGELLYLVAAARAIKSADYWYDSAEQEGVTGRAWAAKLAAERSA